MTAKARSTSPTKLLLTVLSLGAAGCGTSDLVGVHEGRVQFVLSSSPEATTASVTQGPAADEGHGNDHKRGPFFVSANVTFTSVLARNVDGILVDVVMELPTTVDIMTMEGGREITLPDGELPPHTYDQVVVVMSEFQGVTREGTTITIDPPGGGWTAVIPICPFVVAGDATTVVGLTLSIRKSISWRNDRFHFQPHFECEDAGEGEGEGGG